jgi:hypothetical protein
VNPAEERGLLELFSVVDGVCTEPDLFNAERLNVGVGRIFRQWRHARDVLAAQSYIPYRQRIPSEATGEQRLQQSKRSHQPTDPTTGT